MAGAGKASRWQAAATAAPSRTSALIVTMWLKVVPPRCACRWGCRRDAAATGVGADVGALSGGRGPGVRRLGSPPKSYALRHSYMTRTCRDFSAREPRPPREDARFDGDAGRGVHAGCGPAGPFRRGGERGLVTLHIERELARRPGRRRSS